MQCGVGRKGGEHRFVAPSEDCLEFAELARLESACLIESVAKRIELERRHRLEDVDLADEYFENRSNPPQRGESGEGFSSFENRLCASEFVEE